MDKRKTLHTFQELMVSVEKTLNLNVAKDPNIYKNLNASSVEELVFNTTVEQAVDTPFEGTVALVSGHKFPDITVANKFGLEVKMTKQDKWESFGNSIFEGTRIPTIEEVYLIFAKIGGKTEFIIKPYEDCISGAKVDHSPRYHIDMTLDKDDKKSLFSSINMPYDDFRKLPQSQQIALIATEEKKHLKPGENLWWSAVEENTPPQTNLCELSSLSKEKRNDILAEGYALFPELFSSKNNKYSAMAARLVRTKAIISSNLRDFFSSGGRKTLELCDGTTKNVPAYLARVYALRKDISEKIKTLPENTLKEYWGIKNISKDRIQQWLKLVQKEAKTSDLDTIQRIFSGL